MKELEENTIEQIRTLLNYLEQTELLNNKDINKVQMKQLESMEEKQWIKIKSLLLLTVDLKKRLEDKEFVHSLKMYLLAYKCSSGHSV